jgi:hypothetical protein
MCGTMNALFRATVVETLVWLLLVPPSVLAQPSDRVRVRARELHAKGSDVIVSLTGGAVVRGRIVRVEAEALAVRQNTGEEKVLRFDEVADIRKQGGGPPKALWIPLAIGGGVLLALCVMPYPMGFLCRSDPS